MSEFERLKALLLADERSALDAAKERIAALDREQRDLARRLPDAIERAQRGTGAARMADALASPVTRALGSAVRENRQLIVDILFPIIGPAIRKAIAEALRNLVADLNGAVESSLTPRGIRWRIEAWRSGVPYAQVVLKHTLRYRIDHVFLIERDSGLVLARESAPDLPDLDADAIAGMLTAIGAFVSDSVGDSMGGDGANTLESARVGEHLLWVIEGPRANLACFLRGVPPTSLRPVLEQRLEAIHAQLGETETGIAVDDTSRAALRPERLERDARAEEPSARSKSSRWPLLIALLAALALLAWLFARQERWQADIDALRARLAAHPGFVLTGIDERGRDALTVHGLIDPDAEPLATSMKTRDAREVPVTLDTEGYVSTDDAIVARRARRLLAAPDSVTIASRNGVLALGGHAPRVWVDTARERAAWVAGVKNVQFAVAADTDEMAAARAEIDGIAREIEALHVPFVRDTELAPGGADVVDGIARRAGRIAALATKAGIDVAWIAAGTTDEPGSDDLNERLRAERARWLAQALTERGIAGVRFAATDADAARVRQRGAYLRLAREAPQ